MNSRMAEKTQDDLIVQRFWESLSNGTLIIEKKKRTGRGLTFQNNDVMISVPAKAQGNVIHITIRGGYEDEITSTGYMFAALQNDRIWMWEAPDCSGYKISKHKNHNYAVAKITVSDKRQFLKYCEFAGKYFIELDENKDTGKKVFYIRKEAKINDK